MSFVQMMLPNKLILRDIAATENFARAIARWIQLPAVIALHGDVGSGKTTLCHAIVSALSPNSSFAGSPTFSLMHEYLLADGSALVHMDCYRLRNEAEVLALGVEERFYNAIFLVEWPEIMSNILPASAYHVYLSREGTHIICQHNLPL